MGTLWVANTHYVSSSVSISSLSSCTDCVTCCSTWLDQPGLNLKSIRFFNCTHIFIVTRTLNLTYFKWKCISQVQQLWSLNYSGANSRLYFSSILQSAARMCWTICSDTTTYSSLFSTWYAACWLSVIPTLLSALFSMLLF